MGPGFWNPNYSKSYYDTVNSAEEVLSGSMRDFPDYSFEFSKSEYTSFKELVPFIIRENVLSIFSVKELDGLEKRILEITSG